MEKEYSIARSAQKTKKALILTSLFNEPFLCLFSMLPFILRKDFHASALFISIFTMVKPAFAILSFYWSYRFTRGSESLKKNLLLANLLARVPFLFIFWFYNPFYILICVSFYTLFSRAAIPAWMEMIKLNLPEQTRSRWFSYGSIISYSEGILIATLLGASLDHFFISFKTLMILTTILTIIPTILQYQITLPYSQLPIHEVKKPLKQRIIEPWKESLRLIKDHKKFAHFQIGFMLGGAGLMLIQPALPFYFIDKLHLSYTSLQIAITLCKGIGIISLTPLFSKLLPKKSIFLLSSFVCLGFAIFPMMILLGHLSIYYIFAAYLFYGMAQAGSQLIWYLSGPTFSKYSDSSHYSGINVVMVGIRGLIFPPLGGLLCKFTSPSFVIMTGMGLCLTASLYLIKRESFTFESKKADEAL